MKKIQSHKFVFLLFSMLIFGVLIACGNSANMEEIRAYPQFEEILDKFEEEKYSVPEGKFLTFRKKPEGYFVALAEYDSPEEKEEYLFWSLESREYQQLPDDFNAGIPNSFQKIQYLNQAYNFNRMVYFNYDEADEDAIEMLEGADDLTDSLYEALARAYSIRADEVSRKSNVDRDIVPMNDEEAKEFVDYANKCLDTYETLAEMNPEYEVMIGLVGTKIAHDKVHFWYQLEVNGHSDLAKDFLKNVEYDDLIISFAKNMLSTCGKNAILFTYGDSDTFPLWYVQEVLGFRKDVTVINTSLANVPFYNDYHVQKGNVKTILKSEDYGDQALDYLYVDFSYKDGQDDSEIELGEFVRSLKKDRKSEIAEENGAKVIPARTFYIKTKVADSLGQMQSDFILIRPKTSVFYLADIFQLDVIASNFENRPIHFAQSGLGIAKIVSDRRDYILTSKIDADLDGLVRNFQNGSYRDVYEAKKLLVKDFKYGKPSLPFQSKYMASNMRVQFAILANDFLIMEDQKTGIELMEKGEKHFPIDQLELPSGTAAYIGRIWAELDDDRKAQECIDISLNILETEVIENPQTAENSLNIVEDICQTHGLKGADRVKKLRGKLH